MPYGLSSSKQLRSALSILCSIVTTVPSISDDTSTSKLLNSLSVYGSLSSAQGCTVFDFPSSSSLSPISTTLVLDDSSALTTLGLY